VLTLKRRTRLELLGLTLALVVALVGFGVIDLGASGNTAAISAGGVQSDDAEATEEDEVLGPAEPDDWFLVQRAGGPGKTLDQSAFARAAKQAQALRDTTGADASDAPRQLRGQWSLAGPTNIGGRIVDLVVDPVRANTIYVASASGGVWKSTDGVVTMEKAWPDDITQAMGAIAIDSSGRLWAGTGEANPGGGSITFGGNGVYSSDDGGATWKKRGLANSGATGRIAVDPTNPDRIFVAAAGSLFNPGGERGIYRSDNGGASWKLVLAPETPFAGGADLTIDPTNPNRVFAAMWDHRREPDLRTYGGLGSGLFRSDDGGDTWTRLDNTLTNSPGDDSGLKQDASLGRIGVALAPGNPNRVYVISTATFGQDKGFYVSNDGGDSFNAQPRPGSQGGFGWWFGRLWVDPVNPDHVFAAGVSMRRSTNGGATWSNVPGLHADQHAMAWDPAVANRVYVGNDGGTYSSNLNGAGGFVQATREPYTQFYSIDVGELQPDRITGGAQDNGCLRSWSPTTSGNPDNWNSFGCGDGEFTVIDPSDNSIFYGCSQYGACVRRNEGPQPITNRTISNGTVSTRRNWLTPVVLDPNDPATVYYGGNQLNKSTNRGDTWTVLSPPDPVSLPGTFESPDRVDPFYPNYGTLTTIAIAKTAPSTIYVGTDTGRLWRTVDGGANWTWLDSQGLPERWVTRVAIDTTDEDTVYATFSGFRNGEDAAHVFRTTNGGVTWQNISGNLPNAPVNDVVIDKERSTVYVGSDVGVFYLKNGKKNWKPVGEGLPLAPVLDLRLHAPSDTLYTNTFGRSMWKLSLED
jgi:photosystem II stability/assembly factor-like uncharacterized protein